jgi:hypothetical protein
MSMELYINGMEMPEYCYECPCHNGESGYCQLYKDGYLSCIERPAKCPLVPLPEGHGDLVDVKELLNDKEGMQLFKGDFRLAFERIIERANTIVPAEGGNADG